MKQLRPICLDIQPSIFHDLNAVNYNNQKHLVPMSAQGNILKDHTFLSRKRILNRYVLNESESSLVFNSSYSDSQNVNIPPKKRPRVDIASFLQKVASLGTGIVDLEVCCHFFFTFILLWY